MSQLNVTFCPSPVNAWFYRALTTPFVRVDSTTQPCSWGAATTIDVEAGERRVETFVRYKRGRKDLALGGGTCSLPEGGAVSVRAANTFLNQSVFMPDFSGG